MSHPDGSPDGEQQDIDEQVFGADEEEIGSLHEVFRQVYGVGDETC